MEPGQRTQAGGGLGVSRLAKLGFRRRAKEPPKPAQSADISTLLLSKRLVVV